MKDAGSTGCPSVAPPPWAHWDMCQRFSAVVFASGSAGTQAGLVAGKALAGWPGEVLGISAAKRGDELVPEVFALSDETAQFLGTSVREEMVCVDDG